MRTLRRGWALALAAGLAAPAAYGQDTRTVTSRAEALRNAGNFDSAVVLLRAHHLQAPADYNAEAMLAETLYWQGDFTAAARHFRNVLRADPQNKSVIRQVAEIKAASAPWTRVRFQHDDDNQPLTRNSGEVDGGFFMNPLWSLGVRLSTQQAASVDVRLEQTEGRAEIRGYLARARIDFRMSGGVSTWVSTAGVFRGPRVGEPVASAELGHRFSRGASVAGAIDHTIYTATTASLSNPIPYNQARILARLDRRNWLGEAAVQQEIFPDDNSILTTYAWLLAPVLAGRSRLAQAGYAFSFQDSEEGRFSTAGVYDPYFTPEREIQHSVAASFVAWHERGARIQVNGSYALYGRRGIPVGSNPPARPGVGRPASVATESFHPFTLRASGTLPAGRIATFTIEAERNKTSFYQHTRVAALISLRFAPPPAT